MERVKKKKRKVRKSFIAGVIIVPILIAGVIACCYFSSEKGNIKSIKIYNDTFLSDDYILDYLELDLDKKYDLVIPAFIKLKTRNNPLLNNLKIEKAGNGCIILTLKDNPIVAYSSNDANTENPINLVLNDGSTIEFNSELIKSLTLLPLLYEMDENAIVQIAPELSLLKCDVLSRISEICRVSFTYDETMVKCVMDDHYDIYLPIDKVSTLNHYFEIIEDINKESGAILYFEGAFLNMSYEEIFAKIESNASQVED